MTTGGRHGPSVRTDIVDVYVFRAPEGRPADAEFLQLRRVRAPMAGTWQPIMGHVQPGETAAACAGRELREEVGIAGGADTFLGAWALEQVHPFYLPERDCVMLSPRFAVRAAPGWTPTLNDEHDAWRWSPAASVDVDFMWPGQKDACREILAEILREDSLAADRMRVPLL